LPATLLLQAANLPPIRGSDWLFLQYSNQNTQIEPAAASGGRLRFLFHL
jgi:hypothetical protein